ncbi:hypothetical protein [Duganella sp. Root1480D1]|uniref:hypothetical protein n=1 Tax=Duganella sp. Root1480D1 TaxID=1736471 RepID=UPI00070BAC77|nr:hypothetical protein [Duganella sp. Root1480D1]KQZ27706.1 hypothetical protein ASD58_14040 [Duganella sp. Root1480D1]
MEQLTPDERIAAQEKALDGVNCELALLRQHMDARFASMQASTDAQFASMRQYIDDGFVKLRLEMQLYTREEIAKAVAPLQAQIDALRDHVDRISRWGFGMMAMILLGELALLARGLLG